MLHDVLLLTSEIARRVRPRLQEKAQTGCSSLTAWRLPCPARTVATSQSRRQRTAESSAARRPTPLPTCRPPGQFNSSGRHKANFWTGPHVANVPRPSSRRACPRNGRLPVRRERKAPGHLVLHGSAGSCQDAADSAQAGIAAICPGTPEFRTAASCEQRRGYPLIPLPPRASSPADCLAVVCQAVSRTRPGPPNSVSRLVPYAADAAAQYRVLVPEHQQFSSLHPIAAGHQDSHAEHPARQQADDLEQHPASQPSPHQACWR